MRLLNRVAARITTEVIANAGHDLTIAQTERVNQKILEFLGDRPVGRKVG